MAENEEGTVEKELPRGLFLVRLDNGREVRAAIGAAARKVTVRVISGDRVLVSLSPYDPTRGRILSRL